MRHERSLRATAMRILARPASMLVAAVILAPGFCLVPSPVSGEDSEPRPADATIVVSADPVSEAEERAPTSFVDVIDMSQYEGQFETATSVLAQAVGVQVRRFGGLGAFSTLSIRGSNPNQVRFYLDG